MNGPRSYFFLHFALSGVLLTLLAVILFFSVTSDDAHITFWSALSLSEHGAILNYGGGMVEQSSSLLQVVSLALMHKVSSANMALLGWMFSLAFGWIALLAAGRLAALFDSRATAAAMYLTATCYPLVYWSVSGMDATLGAASYTGFVLTTSVFLGSGKGRLPLLFSVAVLLLVRPETVFTSLTAVAFCMLVMLLPSVRASLSSASRQFFSRMIFIAACILTGFILLAVFRYLYFGKIFPEPVYVKAAGTNWYMIKQGVKYFLTLFDRYAVAGWIAGAALFAVTVWRLRKTAAEGITWWAGLSAIAMLVSGVLFTVFTGGDWMENARMYVLFIPLTMAIVAGAFAQSNIRLPGFALLGLLHVVALWKTAAYENRGRPLHTLPLISLQESMRDRFSLVQYGCKDGERDIPVALRLAEIFPAVQQATDGPVRIMSGQGGIIIGHLAQKYFGAFEWMDIWGLTSVQTVECPVSRRIQMSPVPRWSYAAFFEHLDSMRTECPEVFRPDIIFELDDDHSLQPLLEKNGYTVVYAQSGYMLSGDAWMPGIPFNARQIIAVRTEIYRRMQPQPLYFEYMFPFRQLPEGI